MSALLIAAIVLAAIVVLPVAFRVIKLVAGLMLLKHAAGKVLTDAGASAVSRQPDALDLTPIFNATWADADRAASAAASLDSAGFLVTGEYSIAQMPGIILRLFTHPVDGYYAAFFEHPKGIASTEIVCVCEDGSGISLSALPDSGQRYAPNKQRIFMPGAAPADLYARIKGMNPTGPVQRATADNVVRMYQDEYARAIAWRKSHPMTAQEVAASQRMLKQVRDEAA